MPPLLVRTYSVAHEFLLVVVIGRVLELSVLEQLLQAVRAVAPPSATVSSHSVHVLVVVTSSSTSPTTPILLNFWAFPIGGVLAAATGLSIIGSITGTVAVVFSVITAEHHLLAVARIRSRRAGNRVIKHFQELAAPSAIAQVLRVSLLSSLLTAILMIFRLFLRATVVAGL